MTDPAGKRVCDADIEHEPGATAEGGVAWALTIVDVAACDGEDGVRDAQGKAVIRDGTDAGAEGVGVGRDGGLSIHTGTSRAVEGGRGPGSVGRGKAVSEGTDRWR